MVISLEINGQGWMVIWEGDRTSDINTTVPVHLKDDDEIRIKVELSQEEEQQNARLLGPKLLLRRINYV